MKQDEALDILKTGVNVFLTGEPGSGKTYTVNRYVAWLHEQGVPVAVTASTGIAASHLNGQTVHSWSGIGILNALAQKDIEKIIQGRCARRITDTAVLVIDEVSMLSGGVLDMLDRLFRTVRVSAEPFGGMQVLCVGDFFQLPPVAGDEAVSYAFESEAWKRSKMRVCYLTEQHRQKDTDFLTVLRSIRNGTAGEKERKLLSEQRDIAYGGKEPTLLHSHNAAVDRDNIARLADLPGEERVFEMRRNGPEPLTDRMVRNCLSPEVLRLKEGAMVMCTRNNPERGFFNGTLGTVAGFEKESGMPMIETFDGRYVIPDESEWSIVDGEKIIASIRQVPLRLAWAMTIHKSQGISLDAAEICLSGVFLEGQGYVALSRVRTLGGLKVRGNIHPAALQVSRKITEQDGVFREISGRLSDWRAAYPDTLAKKQREFLERFGGIPSRKKKRTVESTKELLREGLSVKEIAQRRNLKRKTVLGHIEKLAAEHAITGDDIAHLFGDNWSDIFSVIEAVFDRLGDGHLSPVHESLKGRRTYETLRLARVCYRLSGK